MDPTNHSGSPVWILALITLVLVLAIVLWSLASIRRRQATNGKTRGLGGPNDPMVGAVDNIRSGDELNASMDAAAADMERRRP